MPIRQITIIGTGLIGGSFALALRKRRFAGRIVGCDRESTLKKAKMRGVIDNGFPEPVDAVRGSQLVVLATPVLAIIDLVGRLGPGLPSTTLLTPSCCAISLRLRVIPVLYCMTEVRLITFKSLILARFESNSS